MKWPIAIVGLMIAVVTCQPSVRYSAEPVRPRSDESTDNSPADSDESRYTAEASLFDKAKFSKVINRYMGAPYRSGGYGRLGIDCSGLVYAVFRDYDNRHLPTQTGKLFRVLPGVRLDQIRYGDLVFFSIDGKRVSHVGIYIGDNKFVHASVSRGVVVSSLDEDYYRESLAGVRRVIG
jgi:lipoprotein Spr